MPSGGARWRSGPGRQEGSVRHGRSPDRSGIVHLPAGGRDGDPPDWPLPGRMTTWERGRWAAEWRRPQAVMWEQLGMEIQVAIYVHSLRLAMGPRAAAGRTKDLSTQMASLGLVPEAMKRLGWVIDAPAPSAATPARRAPGSTAKDRLTLIAGGSNARSA